MKVIPPLNASTAQKMLVIIAALAAYELIISPQLNKRLN